MWTKRVPNKLGAYWFYGNPFALTEASKNENVELHLVYVRQGMNSLIFVADGHFMENKEGYWQPVELPELPELED
jgi:hypothetical protein